MRRSVRKIQLPADFAQQLLDSEIQYKLADIPSKSQLKTLIQLYSLGVEYYESIRSHKYLYFQLKMNEIFNSTATIQALNKEENGKEVESPLKRKLRGQHEEEKILALQIRRKQEKMMQEMVTHANQVVTASTIRKIFVENQVKGRTVIEKVCEQIKDQDCKLEEKIKKRKSRLLLSKSFCSTVAIKEIDTQETLFSDVAQDQPAETKPIEANFGNVIKQNDSDDEGPTDGTLRLNWIEVVDFKKEEGQC